MSDSPIKSRPYRQGENQVCERCVWGRGQHADWCGWAVRLVEGGPTWANFFDPEKWSEYTRA